MMDNEQKLAERASRLASLSKEDWETLHEVTSRILEVLTGDKGIAVLMCDVHGDGNATIDALGNAELIPALMASAAMAAHAMYEKPEGTKLQ